MRNLATALAFFGHALTAIAAGPVVTRQDGRYIAQLEALPGVPVPLEAHGEAPQVIEERAVPEAPGITLVIYRAGDVGTSAAYRIERAVVVDVKAKKVLGDAPWKYDPIESAPELVQPTWKWERARLTVADEAFRDDLALDLR